MDERAAPDGTDLARAEHAGHGHVELLGGHARVVIRQAEHAAATPVAGEQRAAHDPAGDGAQLGPKRLAQVAVSAVGVAHVEAHGLADSRRVADHQGARARVGAHHASDQVVVAAVVGPVLVDDEPCHDPALREELFLRAES